MGESRTGNHSDGALEGWGLKLLSRPPLEKPVFGLEPDNPLLLVEFLEHVLNGDGRDAAPYRFRDAPVFMFEDRPCIALRPSHARGFHGVSKRTEIVYGRGPQKIVLALRRPCVFPPGLDELRKEVHDRGLDSKAPNRPQERGNVNSRSPDLV